MNSDNTINIDHLLKWVGQTEQITDGLTTELVKRFQATFTGDESMGQQKLAGVHWCLGQPAVVQSKLGDDGHPATRVDLAARAQQRKADVGYMRQAMHFGEIPEILKMTAG